MLITTSPSAANPQEAADQHLQRLSAISLFTGAGGLDLGFEAAGFETAVAVELDKAAVKTLRHNRAWEVVQADVCSAAASSQELLGAAGLREGDPDILIGGPPCQPFSKSGFWATGDSRRLDDPRAETLREYLRVLRDLKPKAFLLENVPGIAYCSKDEGLVFLQKEIEKINREVGLTYSFCSATLRATDYGVPQERHRLFVVGHRDGRSFAFPKKTHGEDLGQLPGVEQLLEPVRTAWDAIGDLVEDDMAQLRLTGKWAALLPTIPEGGNYLHHTSRGGGIEIFGWRRRYWSFLLKLSKRLPSWTIAAQPGPAIGPFHWKNRRLSPRELCRLQTIPDSYEVLGSLRDVQRQVGNAVPSALAEKIALEIRRQLFGDPIAAFVKPVLVPPRRLPVPPAERTRPVPRQYLGLVRKHTPHPGTGKGYGARRRSKS
jgi:DNA (cytosine-5)-methyltransferase 1